MQILCHQIQIIKRPPQNVNFGELGFMIMGNFCLLYTLILKVSLMKIIGFIILKRYFYKKKKNTPTIQILP